MAKGKNIQDTNAQPSRWPTEGTDAYGREAQVVKDEVTTRVDEVSKTLFYLGWAEYGMPEDEPFWKIRRIQQVGSVWEQKYAVDGYDGPNQFYRFKWSRRYFLTYL